MSLLENGHNIFREALKKGELGEQYLSRAVSMNRIRILSANEKEGNNRFRV
jgi:hypothetical protein